MLALAALPITTIGARRVATIGLCLAVAIAISLLGLLVSTDPYDRQSYWERLGNTGHQSVRVLLASLIVAQLSGFAAMLLRGRAISSVKLRLLVLGAGGADLVLSGLLTLAVLAGS